MQSILERIVWPATEDEAEEEEECSLEDKCRVAGYLRSFIEDGKSAAIGILLLVFSDYTLVNYIQSSDLSLLTKYTIV